VSALGGRLSLGEAWRGAAQRIGRQEARLLLEQVCGCTHAELITDVGRLLATEQLERFETLLSRRTAGEPLAYLLGSAFFLGLEYQVTPAVLIPRPDTEVLVRLTIERARRLAVPRIVDLGTGSGIVAVSVANAYPSALVTATDVSPAALEVARGNAARHGTTIRFLEGDWYAPLDGERYDLIVSNPPYIAAGDPHLQGDGLPCEPQGALTDGVEGGDGMACIEALVAGARRHLLPGGWLLIEHGYDQAVKVRQLLNAASFAGVNSWPDDAGIERVSGGQV